MSGTPSGFASTTSALVDIAYVEVTEFTEAGRRWVATHARPLDVDSSRSRHSAFAKVRCPYVDVYDGVGESKQPIWNTIQPPGRREGVKVYAGATNRTVSCVFRFQWQDGGAEDDVRKQVQVPADSLTRMAVGFQDSESLMWFPPPVVEVVLPGISMTAIIESCDVRWRAPWWTDPAGTIVPTGADVSLTFAEVRF